jgi:pilus assembly protein CpaB
LVAGLVVALLAGAVAFITLQRATALRAGQETAAGPRVPVVVAVRSIEVRSMLTAEDVEIVEVAVDSAPEGAVRDLESAIGKITMVDLYLGEVLLAQRLVDPDIITGDGRLALLVAEDEVLMAFPVHDLMSAVGILKPGDQVDFLFSLDFPPNRGLEFLAEAEDTEEAETGQAQRTQTTTGEEEQATFTLLQNLTVAAIVIGKSPTGGDTGAPEAILLTVSPQDALLLKYAKDANGVADIVLRAPGVDRPFATEPVDVDYMINRYGIPTEVGR